METNRPARRFALFLVAIAVPGWILVSWWATKQGVAGETLFGEFAPPVAWATALGGASIEAVGSAMAGLRWPIACIGIAALAWLALRPAAQRGALPLAVALALGWAGQSFLLSGATATGAGLLVSAACAGALVTRGAFPNVAISPAREGALILVLLAFFAVWSIYGIEVDPDLYVDELAYLRAARMFAGQLDVGRIIGRGDYKIYVYEQFEAQTIPLVLHAAAISLLPSDVITTRMTSALAVGIALLVAVLVLRREIGSRAALWMLALAVTAPLVTVYSRAGHYISISLLYSVVSFAALAWLWRRWDLPAALVTGVLLGVSIYQYQLSWFVPVFAIGVFVCSPGLWRRKGVVRVAALVAGTAVFVAMPAWIWLDVGFAAVSAQTFDRAAWNERVPDIANPPQEMMTGVVAVAPAPLGATEQRALTARAVERGVDFLNNRTTQGESMAWIFGRRPAVEGLAAELREEGWSVLDYDWFTIYPWRRLPDMLSKLFAEPSFESAGRWVGVPLLNPLLAPLLVVGLVMAWRRRDEPVMRLLLVWVVGGALLPAVAGGPLPRRAILMLPFAYALVALPLVAIGTALAQRGRIARGFSVLLALVMFGAATVTGTYLYHREWQHHAGRLGGGGELLHLVKVSKADSIDEVVLIPPVFPWLEDYLDAGVRSASPVKFVVERLRASLSSAVLMRSCRRMPPFTWMFPDLPDQESSIAALRRHFEVQEALREGIRIVRVTGVRGDFCERLASAPEGARRRD